MNFIHTGIDWAMFVVIWLVQLVIYPGFRRIEKSRFASWHSKYLKIAGAVIGPLMIGQLGFAIWDVYSTRELASIESLYSILVALTWIVTFQVFVPIHDCLQDLGQNGRLIRRLVLANWMRTALWSLIAFL